MTLHLDAAEKESLSEDLLDLVLERAEQALVDADCSDDGPIIRISGSSEPEMESFHAALVDVGKAFPGASFELGAICDRLREVGGKAALRQLETQPHLVQVVRLSLEMFFRRYPCASDFERALKEQEDGDEVVGGSATELWQAHRTLLGVLRQSLH